MLVADRIGVTMHQLPGSVLPSERTGHPKIEGSNITLVTDPRSPRLALDDAGEIGGDVRSHTLEPSNFSPTEARRRVIQPCSDLLPAPHSRPEGVRQCHIVTV
jgi:hypothetical protein